MSVQDRISFDSAELTQILESELDQLNPFRFDAGYRMLLGNRLIEKLNKWDTSIRRQKDAPLTLVVCGEFKRGKSSLINALLGEHVVTTNVTTETITTNRISYGPHENVMVLSGGKRIKLSDEELTRDKLKDILAELPEKASCLELKRPIEILMQMTIIDTPGLGDAMENYAEDVSKALQQADAVAYVLSVGYPLSMQEQLFIKTVIKPQRYTELFLLANSADRLESTEDCERIGTAISSRIADILPGEQPIVVSALDERCRQLEKKRPNEELSNYLEGNFAQFRERLNTLLEDKRDSVIPDRIERLIRSMFDDISEDLTALSNGLSMNTSDSQARIAELNASKETFTEEQQKSYAQIDKLADEFRGDAIGWIDEFISKMEDDVNNLAGIPAEDIKKYYGMYCLDTLQNAIGKCNDYFQMSLYDALDDIADDISKNLSFSENTSMPKFRISLQNQTWTSSDTASFAFSTVSDYLPLLSLVSPVVDFVAGTARQKTIQNSTPDLMKEIKVQYPALRSSALQSLSKAYTDLAARAKVQISDYFDQQIQEVEAQSEQSAMVARQDEDSKQKIREAIEEIRTLMNAIKDRFTSLRGEAAAGLDA